jgi:hypothetical protein
VGNEEEKLLKSATNNDKLYGLMEEERKIIA